MISMRTFIHAFKWSLCSILYIFQEGLQGQLERAMVAEQKKGIAAPGVAAALREKLRGVESQLDRLKIQKKQQENLQRLAERQRQELKVRRAYALRVVST